MEAKRTRTSRPTGKRERTMAGLLFGGCWFIGEESGSDRLGDVDEGEHYSPAVLEGDAEAKLAQAFSRVN